MAYQALRVPIALLHQKVYSTAHRLEKWEGMKIETKKVESTIARVISPTAQSLNSKENLFDRVPYLRKYFVLEKEVGDEVTCRGCDALCPTTDTRTPHFKKCFPVIGRAIKRVFELGRCVVCDRPITERQADSEFYGAPVCSSECMGVWDYFSTEVFQFCLHEEKAGK